MKITAYIATSVDGFIARENGDLDWLPSGDEVGAGEDYGYQAFLDSVDALVMGRSTYEKVLTFGAWPYGDKPVVVLGHRPVTIAPDIAQTVSSLSASPREVVQQLGGQGFDHLYLDGGKTIQGFLTEGLVDELTITTVPILLGRGIPLFGPLPHDVSLRLLETCPFENGFVQLRYEVLRKAA